MRLDRTILGDDVENVQQFLGRNMPELPEDAAQRLMKDYGLVEALALTITADRSTIGFYESCVEVCKHELLEEDSDEHEVRNISTMVANWLCNDLFALVKESATANRNGMDDDAADEEGDGGSLNHVISVEYSNVNAKRLGLLVSLILKETVSTTQAKKLLAVMYHDDLQSDPLAIAEAKGWKLISDPGALEALCRLVLTDGTNHKQLEQYKRGGKHVRKMIKFFKGKIMAESRGNAHPELMAAALDRVLEELAPGVEA